MSETPKFTATDPHVERIRSICDALASIDDARATYQLGSAEHTGLSNVHAWLDGLATQELLASGYLPTDAVQK